MNTFEVLLSEAKKQATNRVWGLTQKAYGLSRISFADLAKVQAQLKETNPNFFKPKSCR